MIDTKMLVTVMTAILGTGVVLNMAGEGYLGQSVQKGAQFITKGYGV